ncbi:hypothetical protein WN55_05733 [Dufourea novaeangliae]|uniref:Uncharacterized protein n=1 Tax=Dufourea novaeangliae TaxID=178035 RepID=A0A154PPN3_DUFNO|nr:hypothetical protein WN55_05733 [Dufourea novaeangliae]
MIAIVTRHHEVCEKSNETDNVEICFANFSRNQHYPLRNSYLGKYTSGSSVGSLQLELLSVGLS